jgi:hypothetical protein
MSVPKPPTVGGQLPRRSQPEPLRELEEVHVKRSP